MKRKRSAVKEKIGKTIIDLLGEKSISEIRISELTERSKVARASFYRNYNSLDDVLDDLALCFASELTEKYIPLLFNDDYREWYNTTKKILTEIYNKKEKFNDVLTNNLRIIFYKIQAICASDEAHIWNDDYKKYEHIAKISAFYSVCMCWIRNGAKESIEDMATFILGRVLMINKVA